MYPVAWGEALRESEYTQWIYVEFVEWIKMSNKDEIDYLIGRWGLAGLTVASVCRRMA